MNDRIGGSMRRAYDEGYAAGKKAGKITCEKCGKCMIIEETNRLFCTKPFGCDGLVPVEPNDFCSYAEKRGSK